MPRKIEPTITLPEAVAAVLFALEFPGLLRDFYDIALLLQQHPGAVRKIVCQWSMAVANNPNPSIDPLA